MALSEARLRELAQRMAAHIGAAPAPKRRLRLVKATSPEEVARHAYAYYDFNAAAPAPLQQTPAARTGREIQRIAGWYGWQNEVQRALDAARATALADLADDDRDALLERMQRLENCIQSGCDAPDSAPAR